MNNEYRFGDYLHKYSYKIQRSYYDSLDVWQKSAMSSDPGATAPKRQRALDAGMPWSTTEKIVEDLKQYSDCYTNPRKTRAISIEAEWQDCYYILVRRHFQVLVWHKI